jgi:hypothetical protein
MNNQVTALKQHFEELFPGKWAHESSRQKHIATGLSEIDQGITHGLVRKRITEWLGPVSSGKTTLLRTTVAHLCASGLNVAYIDSQSQLLAGDWAFVSEGKCGTKLESAPHLVSNTEKPSGRFWVVRLNNKGDKDSAAEKQLAKQALWSTDQLIATNAFDLVILDLGKLHCLSSKTYARLQRSLDKSKTALLVVRDGNATTSSWGSSRRISFQWGQTNCQMGLSGIASILPTVACSAWKDGLSQTTEIVFSKDWVSHVSNRLFTHPTVPDRRTAKA